MSNHDVAQHAKRHNLYIEDLFIQTKKFADEVNKKANSKPMTGRCLYDFPNLQVLQERNEKQVQRNFEKETIQELGGDESTFGLAMMANEKTEIEMDKPVEPPHEINNHVQFLTDDMKNETGGKKAIFEQDPLNKKPGATYSFIELCEIESRLMKDNSNEFEKKILNPDILIKNSNKIFDNAEKRINSKSNK